MLEVVWDTTPFNDKSIWPADGSQPFVLSQGDPTGFGQHADYVFGWKDQVLQKAMDTAGCMGAKCGTLKTQDITTAKACNVKKAVQEDHDGCEFPPPQTRTLHSCEDISDHLIFRAHRAPRHGHG